MIFPWGKSCVPNFYYLYFDKIILYIMKRKLLVLVLLMAAMSFSSYAQKIKYQGEINVGHSFGMGIDEWNFDRFTIETVHGMRVNEYLFVGAGAGWHHFVNGAEKFSVVPVYFNAKGYLKAGKITPFASFDIGIGLPFGQPYGHRGLYISPAIGANYKITPKNTLGLVLGYQSQKLPGYGSTLVMDAVSIKLAFGF